MSAPEQPTRTVVELQRHADAELERIAPVVDDLGRVFADAGHELALVGGPVRDAMLGRPHSDLDFATSARPDDTERLLAAWGDATWDMGRDFGTIGCRKGPWTVEVTTYRSEAYDPSSRKPTVDFGDTLDGRPGPPRLHRQRDGRPPARPGRRGSVRRGDRPRVRSPPDAGHAGGLVLRRPAADAARGAVRRAARLRRRTRGGRGDEGDGRRGSRSSRPSGSATSS